MPSPEPKSPGTREEASRTTSKAITIIKSSVIESNGTFRLAFIIVVSIPVGKTVVW